jgi:hypothetical protein
VRKRTVNQNVLPFPSWVATPTSPPHQLCQTLADGESQTRAAIAARRRAIRLLESREQRQQELQA